MKSVREHSSIVKELHNLDEANMWNYIKAILKVQREIFFSFFKTMEIYIYKTEMSFHENACHLNQGCRNTFFFSSFF